MTIGMGQPAFPAWVAGSYVFLPNATNTSTSATLGVGTMRAVPFYVPHALALDRIGAEITSAGDAASKLRLGIYATGANGRPSTLVIDAGTIAADSATVQEITISLPLGPGWYWVAAAVQVVTVTQPTVRTAAAGSFGIMPVTHLVTPTAGQVTSGYIQTSVTGAFPATMTPGDIHNSFPRVHARIA
jgi:hypothetical protein